MTTFAKYKVNCAKRCPGRKKERESESDINETGRIKRKIIPEKVYNRKKKDISLYSGITITGINNFHRKINKKFLVNFYVCVCMYTYKYTYHRVLFNSSQFVSPIPPRIK